MKPCKDFKQRESLIPGVALLFADEVCSNCARFVSECVDKWKKEKVGRKYAEFMHVRS